MLEHIDIDKVLELIKNHAMNILGKRFYIPVECDDDDSSEIVGIKLSNLRCYDVNVNSEYSIENIKLDNCYRMTGCVDNNDIGTKVFLEEKNAQLASEGKEYVVTDETLLIKQEISEIQKLVNLLRGQNAIFTLKYENTTEKYERFQAVVLKIKTIEVLTASYVPGGSFTDRCGGVFIEGYDDIGCVEQQYGVMCFSDLNMAMDNVFRRNHDSLVARNTKLHAIAEIEKTMIKNVPPNELNINTKNILIHNGFASIGDLTKLSSEEIKNIYGVGQKRYEEIISFLSGRGIEAANKSSLQ